MEGGKGEREGEKGERAAEHGIVVRVWASGGAGGGRKLVRSGGAYP